MENSTILDLANFSTLIIDIPSPDVTIVLKMEPSEDISFMLFLGYEDYPTNENYVAMTQLPQENFPPGKSKTCTCRETRLDTFISNEYRHAHLTPYSNIFDQCRQKNFAIPDLIGIWPFSVVFCIFPTYWSIMATKLKGLISDFQMIWLVWFLSTPLTETGLQHCNKVSVE